MLQLRVNEETADVDGHRAASMTELNAATQEKIGTIRDAQQSVQDAADKIHQELMGPD